MDRRDEEDGCASGEGRAVQGACATGWGDRVSEIVGRMESVLAVRVEIAIGESGECVCVLVEEVCGWQRMETVLVGRVDCASGSWWIYWWGK